jgi:hypothetical protein
MAITAEMPHAGSDPMKGTLRPESCQLIGCVITVNTSVPMSVEFCCISEFREELMAVPNQF